MARPATAAVRLLTGEREPVRLATTVSILLHGLQIIDGVPCEVGDRVLVKDQADQRQNGIYTASEGEWFRAADARTARAMQKGTTVHTQVGSANAGRVFEFMADEPAVGSDAITIVPFVPPDVAEVVDEVEALRDETQVLKDATGASAGQAAASAASSAANAGLTAADVVTTAANLAGAQAARDASLYGKGIFPTIAAAIGLGVIGSGAITAGGALTQILITAPGSYTVAPNFSFAASAGLAGVAAAVVLGKNADVGEYFWTEVSAGVLGLYNVTAGPVATDTGVRAATSSLMSAVELMMMIQGLSLPTTKVVESIGSGVSPSVYRSYSFVSGDTIEHVVIARAGERTMLQLIHTAAGAAYTANFNLEEGVVVSTSGANIVSASISALGGGWFECKAVVLVGSNVTNNVQARMSAAGNLPYTGDGTSGLYIRSIILRKQGLTANLFPSSDPANAAFTKQNVTVTTTTSPNAPSLITLPDTVEELYIRAIGRMSATKLVEPSGSASPSVYQAKSVVLGDAVVWKVIVKKGERYRLNLFSNNAAIFNCTFDLENGTASGTGASIVALGNDWYECTVIVTATASASTNWQHRIFAAAGTHPYVGDGASGLYVQSSKLHLNGGANLFGDSENHSTSAWTKSAGVTAVANAALYLGLLAKGADIGGDPYDDGREALVGKKLATLGDSITIAGFYTSVIASQTGMVLTNLGVSGASLGQSTTAYASFGIYNQIANIPADTEVVTIAAGINDFGAQEVVLGVLGQTTTATFYGALWAAVAAIRTQAPNAKIIFFVPYSGDSTHATHRIMRTNGQGNTLDQFMRAVREVALLTSCAYLDVGGESGLGYFMPASYTSDGLHINAVGGLRYGIYSVEGLRRLSRAGYFGA
ncbi:SGNH/GDSL hydrolase family protein [Mesorhizobium sp.]|uniref:SGNH/GDSL hydrolase family protein n=2 Tax=Mesorhizobium sp. TaxID=1871066 RepID=UPI000FE59643|nr:SGNH/GDSL hydrolase family protein [Mesorhizobium sp.]RWD44653.1 MAG: SGNH/GDSL hydrolase family protein [Mesorhizobium sp.]